jgi:hypothetical protein
MKGLETKPANKVYEQQLPAWIGGHGTGAA